MTNWTTTSDFRKKILVPILLICPLSEGIILSLDKNKAG